MKKFFPTLFVACCLQLSLLPSVEAKPLSEKVKVAEAQPAKLNINTATASELESLPGIGAKKALAIVSYRDVHGDFKSVQDLTLVKGIGQKMLSKFSEKVAVQ